MTRTRKIEIFSAGCAICQQTVDMVRNAACPSCDVIVLDMGDASVAARAKSIGIKAVPAVLVDGTLANCCTGAGPDEATLRRAGLGQPIS